VKRPAHPSLSTRATLAATILAASLAPSVVAQVRQDASSTAAAASSLPQSWFGRQLRKFRSHPHFDRAYRLSAAGRLRDAADEFARGLAIDSTNTTAGVDYVQVLGRLQRHQAVIVEVDRLLRAGFDSTLARAWRATAYEALGQSERAAPDHEVVGASPEASPLQRQYALKAIAEVAGKRGRYDEAIRALDRVDAAGRDADYFSRRALVAEALGRLADASADHRRAAERADDVRQRTRSLAASARVAEMQGDVGGAWQTLRDAVALDAADPGLTQALSELARRRQRYDEAVQWARKTVALRRGEREREHLAEVLMAAREYSAAASEYSGLLPDLKESRDRRRVQFALGAAYAALGQRAKAAEAMAMARAEQPLATADGSGPGSAEASAASPAQRLASQSRPADEARGATLVGEAGPARAYLEAAYRAGNYEEAIRWSGWLVQQAPTTADREFLANLLYAHRDYADAIREYQALLPALKDPSQRHRIHMAIGYSHSALRQFKPAAEAFGKAFELKAGVETLRAWTRALEAAGDADGLARALERSLAQNPAAEARVKLASIYVERRQEEPALAQLRKVTEENASRSATVDAYRRLARLHVLRGEARDARAAAAAWVELAPQDAEAHLILARLDLDDNLPHAAVPHLQRSLQLAPAAEGHRLLGHAYGLLGDWAAAAAARRAELASPGLSEAERSEAYKALGHALAQARDWNGAADTYEALFVLPGQGAEQRAQTAALLASAYAAANRHSETAAVVERAVASGAGTPQLRLTAGFALFAEKRWRDALEQFRAAYAATPSVTTGGLRGPLLREARHARPGDPLLAGWPPGARRGRQRGSGRDLRATRQPLRRELRFHSRRRNAAEGGGDSAQPGARASPRPHAVARRPEGPCRHDARGGQGRGIADRAPSAKTRPSARASS
jgi:tetratricopeptide (TPR) repeat protein